jgi:hypothetical protein
MARVSSTLATADLPEAPQTLRRPTAISKITESIYGSPKKERQARGDAYVPILVVETDSEVLETESRVRRPKRNAKLPKRFEDC